VELYLHSTYPFRGSIKLRDNFTLLEVKRFKYDKRMPKCFVKVTGIFRIEAILINNKNMIYIYRPWVLILQIHFQSWQRECGWHVRKRLVPPDNK
jgi:hypothetical protein